MSAFNLKTIAHLARIHFEEAELKVFESQVAEIFKFVEELGAVDTKGVEPTSHPLALSNVFRKDEIIPSLKLEEFLKKAPAAHGHFFEVPKIIQDK